MTVPYFPATSADALVSAVPQQVGLDLAAHAPAEFWAAVDAAGDDIRVTADDGATQYGYRLVDFDSGAETGWILLDGSGLSASADTTLRVHVDGSMPAPPADRYADPLLYLLDTDLESASSADHSPQALAVTSSGTVNVTAGLVGDQIDVSAGEVRYTWDAISPADEGEVSGTPTSGVVNTGWANTGVAVHPTLDGGGPAFVVAAYHSTAATSELQVYAIGDFTTELDSVVIGFQPQGVAVDGAGVVWVADPAGEKLEAYDPASAWANVGTITLPSGFAPNGLFYRASNNRLYVHEQGAGTVRLYNPDDGSADGTITWDQNSADGACWWPDLGLAVVTVDPGSVFFVDLVTGVTFGGIATGLGQIEGVAVHGSNLWMCNDAGFHAATANGNRVWSVPLAQLPVRTTNQGPFTFRAVTQTDAVTGTDSFFGYGNPVGGTGWGLYTTATTNHRLIVRDGTTQAVADRTITAARHVVHVTVERGAVDEARIYVDGALSGAAVNISTVTGGLHNSAVRRFAAGNLPDGDTARNYDGKLDQAMARLGAMTAAEVATEYAWMTNQAGFWSAGAWVGGGVSTGAARRRRILCGSR